MSFKETSDFILNSSYGLRYTPLTTEDPTTGTPGVTTAKDPILPMYISIPGPNGERLSFTMLVNPSHVNHGKTFETIPQFTNVGYVIQHWGPNQDTLTADGRTAAFMVDDEGLTYRYRSSSYAFLNFMALFNSYKNNGYRIGPDGFGKDPQIDLIQGVEIAYDGDLFTGHFSNFTLDEDAASPYSFHYNFEFIISSVNGAIGTGFDDISGHYVPLPTDRPPEERAVTTLVNTVADTETVNKSVKVKSEPVGTSFAGGGTTRSLAQTDFVSVSANSTYVALSVPKEVPVSDALLTDQQMAEKLFYGKGK